MARKQAFQRGAYFRLARLAEVAGSSIEAVISAARICGIVRVGDFLWFRGGTVTLDFADELVLARDAERAAAQRQQRAAARNIGGVPGEK